MNNCRSQTLEMNQLTVCYNDSVVISNLSATIPLGTLVAIIGPNGAGKSTLLKTMLGLIKPLSGTVSFLGTSLEKQREHIAYVPQRLSVDWDFPVTVLDVVLMGSYAKLGWFRMPGKKEKEEAMIQLSRVGMAAYADRHIKELSGGQQQRVFIARALMQQASLFLMDEPFAGIDYMSEKVILAILKELQAVGNTILVVHHDLSIVAEHFDWILLMNNQKVACGPKEEILKSDLLSRTYGNRTIFPIM